MPRFTPNPNDTTFGFIVYPLGIYRLEIGEPKSFYKKATEQDKSDNYGVRVNGKVISSNEHPELVGKNFPINMYMHTPDSEGFSKGIYARILGAENDDQFSSMGFGNLDWSYNTDDSSVGEGWHSLKGKVVDVEVGDPKVDKSGNPQTNVKAWRVAK